MKVGISYAVELEDIPEEVENLLRDVQWDLSGKIEEIITQVRSGDFSTLAVDIKTLRDNLGRTETRLEDCYAILAGYVSILNQLAEKAAQAAQEAATAQSEEPNSPPAAKVEQIGPGHKVISATPADEYDPND
tara:strand:+ start:228 stop:626 length:399 start_codon:yes stop_codon:yes gene_type:complete